MTDGDDGRGAARLPELREHLARHLPGAVSELNLPGAAPQAPPVRLLAIDRPGVGKVLVTEGMSAEPMVAPPGGGPFRFAELSLGLPAGWPLDAASLADESYSWPARWLLRLARYPRRLGRAIGPATTYDNAGPLAPGIGFTAWLVVARGDGRGSYVRADGEQVVVYSVFALDPDELAFEQGEGLGALMTLFEAAGLTEGMVVGRPSVIRAAGSGGR